MPKRNRVIKKVAKKVGESVIPVHGVCLSRDSYSKAWDFMTQ